MGKSRLSLALAGVPDGSVAVFCAVADTDLSALPQQNVAIITGFKPDHAVWTSRGYACDVQPHGEYASAVVIIPRAKAQARALIAQALSLTNGGPVWVDGQKTDGIDSLWKDCRARAEITDMVTKEHGRAFCIVGDAADFSDWAALTPAPLPEGFVTAPGVFSSDGIDPGSAMLAEALPQDLKGQVADLGAGWGYLSARLLANCPKVAAVHLIEADHAALECARKNVTDPRATFHWQDATRFRLPDAMDHVICNPPFHTGRKAEPALGVSFLKAAAAQLKASGSLWVVANRHLPYERDLATLFRSVTEVAGNNSYKILRAIGPARRRP